MILADDPDFAALLPELVTPESLPQWAGVIEVVEADSTAGE